MIRRRTGAEGEQQLDVDPARKESGDSFGLSRFRACARVPGGLGDLGGGGNGSSVDA